MGKPMKIFVDGLKHADIVLDLPNGQAEPLLKTERERLANAFAQGFFFALDRMNREGFFVEPQSKEARAFNVWLADVLNEIEAEAKKESP